jgi:ABC-type glycerol-3-phosphate transport system substrate-binding protein
MDVFWSRSPSQVMQFAQNKAVQDLSGFAAASGLDLTPIRDTTLVPVTDADGKFYGLPTTGSAWMLFYNKDLFDAAGVAYPINLTWAQYADLAKQLTGEKDGVKYWGGVYPTWSVTLGANAAGEFLTDADLNYTKEYLRVLRRLYTDDKSHISLEEMSGTNFEAYSAFAGGQVYMMPMGDWSFNLVPDYNPAFTFAAAPFPTLEGVPAGSTIGQASYLCISPTSQFQEAAYKLIEFCTTSEAGTSVYARYQYVPSYTTDAAMAVYQENVKVPGVEYRFSAKIGPETGPESYYGDLGDAYKQEAELYLLDEQSFEDTFANYTRLRDEIISR